MNDSRPCLFTTPDLGLANRLRGLVALWAHAKKNKRPLHVLWTPSDACPYRIEDMFEPLSDTTYIQTQESEDMYSRSSSDLGHLSHSLPTYGISYAMAHLLIASLVKHSCILHKWKHAYSMFNRICTFISQNYPLA